MRLMVFAVLVVGFTGLTATGASAAGISRKALVVGIDQYDVSPAPVRSMNGLKGAVSDAKNMAGALRQTFGFAADDITLLLNQKADRAGILREIRKLADGAGPGDVRVFYFSGHGSQERNDASPEPDKLDETIVPFDAQTGAPDLRDKELAREFDAILDRGVVLTIILDSCHSGSAVRGVDNPLSGRAKSAPMSAHTISDPSMPVPPELRGALVLSAAQDIEVAVELPPPNARGAFTWALLGAFNDPEAKTEPAHRLFLRTKQLIKGTTTQTPVLAGTQQRQRATLFDATPAAVISKIEVAVSFRDGKLVVDAGNALGIGVGSILGKRSGKDSFAAKLEVTAIDGPTSAVAEMREGDETVARKGGLFEVVQWSATPGTNLLVDLGRDQAVDATDLDRLQADLAAVKAKHGVDWSTDPARWKYWLEWERTSHGSTWVLYGPTEAKVLTSKELRAWQPPAGDVPARVYATLPPPRALVEKLRARWQRPGGLVTISGSRAEAHYRLVGQLGASAAEYGLVRAARFAAGPTAGMPARTDLQSIGTEQGGVANAAAQLQDTAERLARMYGWLVLRSPAQSDARFPYRVVLRRSDGKVTRGDTGSVVAGETYGLALRADPKSLEGVQPRWIYVFAMDSFGRRQLLFPPPGYGDVENRIPRPETKATAEIILNDRLFKVSPPFGVDNFFMLATDAKLPDPEVLNEDGVRTRGVRGPGGEALPIDLLTPVTQRTRGFKAVPQAADWTLQRIEVTSVAGAQ